jgi:hypothetical protein
MTAGDKSISVSRVTGIEDEDSIGIGLDDGTIFWTAVVHIPSDRDVTLLAGSFSPAASGNTVYVKGASFEDTIPVPRGAVESLTVRSYMTYDENSNKFLVISVATNLSSYVKVTGTKMVSGAVTDIGMFVYENNEYSKAIIDITSLPTSVSVDSTGGGSSVYTIPTESLDILLAIWNSVAKTFTVECVCSPGPTLTAESNIGVLGDLTFIGGNVYLGTFTNVTAKPLFVKVTSTGGAVTVLNL